MKDSQRVSRANGNASKSSAGCPPAFITGTRQGRRAARSGTLPIERDRRAPGSSGITSTSVYGTERLIDPHSVAHSRWANRHPSSYLHEEFLELKRQITESGGNTVPIKVRPIPSTSGVVTTADFEVVWGHRRHRACLEAGLPVRAYVEAVTDEQLVAQMHTENLNRKDLTAYERGRAYDRMIVEGLYPNQLVLAQRLGVNAGDVSRLRFLGTLSGEILAIMQSPLDLAIHDADKLRPALAEHGDEVLRRVSEIAENEGRLPTKQVVRRLTDFAPKAATANSGIVRSIEIDGQSFGHIKLGGDRHPEVKLTVPLSLRDVNSLEKTMCAFLRKALRTGGRE